MKFLAAIILGVCLACSGQAQAQSATESNKATSDSKASTRAAAAARSQARDNDHEAAIFMNRRPARLGPIVGSAETSLGPFKRPRHMRGERPDYMRSAGGGVGLAFSFKLGS